MSSPSQRLIAGRFRVIRRLGAGAMASVVLAEDTELGRRVAIKRMHADASADSAPRFRREMRVAASLSHPNLVTLFDAIESEGAVLLVMECVDGPTLARRMGDGPLDPETALRILRELAAAVDYLHEQGVIHRDIKPANILLDAEGRVKLTDLGIASAAQATGITTTGTVLGTPAYMAPELFDGERATPAADVYSVAALAFEMLSGRRAREGSSPAAIALKVATEPPPDLREAWPEAGAAAGVLERGMARDPDERPATATALVDEVEGALQESESPGTEELPATERFGPPPIQPDEPIDAAKPATPAEPAAEPAPAPAEPAPAPTPAAPAPAPQGTAAVPVRPAASGERPEPRERGRRERSSPAVLLAAAAALAAAAIVAVIIAGGGSDPGGATGADSTSKTSTHTTSSKARAAAASPATPAGAVKAFYTRAAAHRYDDAWALAAPGVRGQLGGFAAFQQQFAPVRSIVFSRATAVQQTSGAATVAIATTATHTDHVDHCTGTAQTAPGTGGDWVVTHLDVACRSGTSAG